MPLLKEMIDEFPEYHFGIMQHSRSGSFNYTCRDQFQKGKEGYATIMAAVLRENSDVTFAGIISMLGDVEVQSSTGFSSWEHINNFASDIESMVDAMRTDLGLEPPRLPYLHTEIPYGEGIWDPQLEECREIRNQTRLIAESVECAAVVPSEGITLRDDHHYNLNGYMMWADRVADIMEQKGWKPALSSVSVRLPLMPARDATTGTWRLVPALSNRVDHQLESGAAVYRIDGTRYRAIAELGEGGHGVFIQARGRKDDTGADAPF